MFHLFIFCNISVAGARDRLLPWHLSNYRGIRKLPGVYELISLHGFLVAAQIPGQASLMGSDPTET